MVPIMNLQISTKRTSNVVHELSDLESSGHEHACTALSFLLPVLLALACSLPAANYAFGVRFSVHSTVLLLFLDLLLLSLVFSVLWVFHKNTVYCRASEDAAFGQTLIIFFHSIHPDLVSRAALFSCSLGFVPIFCTPRQVQSRCDLSLKLQREWERKHTSSLYVMLGYYAMHHGNECN